MVLANTKQAAKTPKITPIQLILFGLLIGWMVISNLNAFKGLDFWVQAAISIIFYIAIMLTAGQRGSVSDLVKQLIAIIVSDENKDTKLLKLQNLVVACCQELGILYEAEKEKFFTYLEETTGKTEAIELLRTQIAEIEAKLESNNI